MQGQHKFKVRPTDPGKVLVEVDLPGGPWGQPSVVDIGPEDCTLRWGRDASPAIPIGHGFQAIIRFSESDAAFHCRVRAVARLEGESVRTYRFELRFHESVLDTYVAALVGAFDRRLTPRVAPAKETVVETALSLPDGTCEVSARLLDVSEGGVALIAEPGVDEAFAEADALRVRLALPTEDGPLGFLTTVRARQRLPEGVLYRMQLVPSSKDDDTQERLRRYVAVTRAQSGAASGLEKATRD